MKPGLTNLIVKCLRDLHQKVQPRFNNFEVLWMEELSII